jgi:cell division protein FtsI/penicillin-binding protein 2
MALSKKLERSLDRFKFQTIRRSLLLGALLAVWMVVILLRLYDLQIIQYAGLMNRAERQQERVVEVAPHRGTIYDRSMRPLAMSLAVDSIYAVPSQIAHPEVTAERLAAILNLDADDLAGRLKAYRSFCWIKRKVTSEEAKSIRALELRGIYFEKETKRFYPNGDLAAHVLGYVGMDDNGLGGLEYALNSQIRGQPGRMLISTDARRQSYRSVERQGEPGMNAVLTIDENIQYIAERALDAAVKKFHAAGGTVIVMDPHSGDILALANDPTFNPNAYEQSKTQDRIDRAVGWIYEPGSTFKLVTMSAALDYHLISPDELIDCGGSGIVLAGHLIHNDEHFGVMTIADALAHSSNVAAIKIALQLGEARFYNYIERFGFGSRTDMGLPGEDRGLVRPPSQWSGISIGEMAMGQGVGVTPIQIITAYSSVANDGVLVAPRIVRQLFRGDEHEMETPSAGRRIISPQTAQEMKQMLHGVIEHGTGMEAQLSGYTAAGKTGTSQKVDSTGHYSHSKFVSSFVGFAPVENPAVTILAVIDTPVGAYYGTKVAAPVFRSIAQQTLCYLNIPQNNPSRLLQADSRAPSGSTRQKRDDPAGIPPSEPESTGAAIRPVTLLSYAGPPASLAAGTEMVLEGPMLTVPDFAGLAVRRVSDECQHLGLEMEMAGAGLAVKQDPPPGSRITRGATVRVEFAR